jgi:excisionase family DNA binding protein
MEAALEFSVSRRTIERWIAAGLLNAEPAPTDRRKRLVRFEQVKRLVEAKAAPVRKKHDSPQERETVEVLEGDAAEPNHLDFSGITESDLEIIDNALQLAYSYAHRLMSQLHPPWFTPISLDQLRSSPMGHDLIRLAQVANGHSREDKESVLGAIDSVLQLLFWPMAAEDYVVPRVFWQTDCGRLLQRAKFSVYLPSELMTIEEAALRMNVSRAAVYKWMDDRSLNYLRDEKSGRTYIVRKDVENIIRVASEF